MISRPFSMAVREEDEVKKFSKVFWVNTCKTKNVTKIIIRTTIFFIKSCEKIIYYIVIF